MDIDDIGTELTVLIDSSFDYLGDIRIKTFGKILLWQTYFQAGQGAATGHAEPP